MLKMEVDSVFQRRPVFYVLYCQNEGTCQIEGMARPWRVRYSGAKYHVTSRGNPRQRIFFGKDDYLRFLEQLEAGLEKDEVILYAFCLMPNHFHLFVETPLGNIHRFMQRLNTAYSMYFRYKHDRPGHCLQGRYGAKLLGR